MPEEAIDQNLEPTNLPTDGDPSVTAPVTDGEPGTPEVKPTIPETVPYTRFQEVNTEKNDLRATNERLLAILERSGTAAQPAAPPAQVPEPPKPELLSMPTREQFTKEVDGYPEFDEAAYMAKIGEVAQENAVRVVRHESSVETVKTDMARRQEKGNALVNEVIEKHPEFKDLMNQNTPSPAVGEALFILGDDQEDRPAVVEAAYFLAKNPAELRRLNALQPQAAIAAVGKLVAKLALSMPKAKTVSDAPNPIETVKTTEVPTNFDPNKSSTEDYVRHSGHPAVAACPWLVK